MNHPITFFHKRQQDAGYTRDFELRTPTQACRIFVYSRSEVDKAATKNRQVTDYEQEMSRIREAVGPGGAVVQVYEEKRKRFFRVSPVGKEGSSFGSYGVVRPGSGLELTEVKLDKWVETPAGTHVLVPVDPEAEEHLRGLKEYLDWLPADLESLILHSIRKPSLDARIRDLEEGNAKVAGRPALGQIQERLIPILLVLIVLLNVAMLFLNVGLFIQSSQNTDGSTGAEDEGVAGTPPVDEPNPTNAEEHERKIFEIVQAIQGKAESIPAFKDLRDGNFKGLAQEQNVTEALKDKARTNMLVLGLMKLEALRLDSAKTPTTLFTTADNPTALKGVFQAIGQEAVQDEQTKYLLAALGCLIHSEPGLPKTKTEAHLFVQDQKCEDFSLEAAEPGLEHLLNFVKDYSTS